MRTVVRRDRVLDWLLEADQPSIRYLTQTRLLRKSETDPDVRDAKARIPTTGWAAEILARRSSKMITLRALTVLSRVG